MIGSILLQSLCALLLGLVRSRKPHARSICHPACTLCLVKLFYIIECAISPHSFEFYFLVHEKPLHAMRKMTKPRKAMMKNIKCSLFVYSWVGKIRVSHCCTVTPLISRGGGRGVNNIQTTSARAASPCFPAERSGDISLNSVEIHGLSGVL